MYQITSSPSLNFCRVSNRTITVGNVYVIFLHYDDFFRSKECTLILTPEQVLFLNIVIMPVQPIIYEKNMQKLYRKQ